MPPTSRICTSLQGAKKPLTFWYHCAIIFPIKFQYIELKGGLLANIKLGLGRSAETGSDSKGEDL